jgi:hypothetical protein
METVCHKQLTFESLFSKEIIADFEGGRITSDGGGLLLRELDQRCRIAEKAASCLHDPRDSGKVKHDLLTLVRQRLFAIAQGYEDNNDAATLAKDPAFKIMAGRAPKSAADLASQPTLSRFGEYGGHQEPPSSLRLVVGPLFEDPSRAPQGDRFGCGRH